MENIEYQISQYLDGELGEEETQKLFSRLSEDPKAGILIYEHIRLKYRTKKYYESLDLPSYHEKTAEQNTKALYWWASLASAAAVLLIVIMVFNNARIDRVQQDNKQITATLTELNNLVQSLQAANTQLVNQNRVLIKPSATDTMQQASQKKTIKTLSLQPEHKQFAAGQNNRKIIEITRAQFIHQPMIGN